MIEFTLSACGKRSEAVYEKKVTRSALPREGERFAFTYPFNEGPKPVAPGQDPVDIDKDYALVRAVWHELDDKYVVDIEIDNNKVLHSLPGYDGWKPLKSAN